MAPEMAHGHSGRLADVWGLLQLAEILAVERPPRYWESHAGCAGHPLVDDPERRFGVLHFEVAAARADVLAHSRFRRQLSLRAGSPHALRILPGSPLLAMTELGARCEYVFHVADPACVDNVQAWATSLGLGEQVRAAAGDGTTALQAELAAAADPGDILVHIGAVSPGPSGLSAVDLAAEVARRGALLVLWYGYDRPARRGLPLKELAVLAPGVPLWCGDIMVTAADRTEVASDGDLAVATTPGTGFGIVCANLSAGTTTICDALGTALAAAYRGAPLPDGTPALLRYRSESVG